jgi:hypothetical protein
MSEVSNRKGYDQAGKHLGDQDPVGFLQLLGAIRVGEDVEVEVIERELITPARAVDGLYRVRTAECARLIHGEIQAHWKGAVPPRIADYGARIHLLTGEQVESYVLVLTNDPAPPRVPPPAEIRSGDLVILKGYHLVRLWELDADEWLATERPYLMPYIPLMRGGEPHLVAAAQVLSKIPDEEQRQTLSAYFAILGGLRYDRDILRSILKEALMQIPMEDFRRSSIVQAWLEEGLEKGLEEGLEKGLEEGLEKGLEKGRQEGRAAAVYEMVRRAAARSFPTVQIGSELEAITNLEALEDLCLTMHELPDAAALQARLLDLMPSNQ